MPTVTQETITLEYLYALLGQSSAGQGPKGRRLAEIVWLKYCDEPTWTNQQLSRRYALTTTRIGQIIAKGLRMMRHPTRARPFAPYARTKLGEAVFGPLTDVEFEEFQERVARAQREIESRRAIREEVVEDEDDVSAFNAAWDNEC